MTMANPKRIIFCGAIAGLMLVLSGCASTSERGSPQSLDAEDTARAHEQVGAAAISRKQLTELNDASGLNDYLAYAALNNPQLEAAFNRWSDGLAATARAFFRGRKAIGQNRLIRREQQQGRYWLHTSDQFTATLQRSGFAISHDGEWLAVGGAEKDTKKTEQGEGVEHVSAHRAGHYLPPVGAAGLGTV
jgi:hypothetical protein